MAKAFGRPSTRPGSCLRSNPQAVSPPDGAAIPDAVTCDSDDYKNTFYGILNAQGQFWTPIPFGNKSDARQYLEKYAIGDNRRMLETHKIVPVRIQLTALSTPTGDSHDRS